LGADVPDSGISLGSARVYVFEMVRPA